MEQKKKVLVLDESADIRAAVTAVLRQHNVVAAGARNSEEAEMMVGASPVKKTVPYDMLILDIQPGKQSSLDFLRKVRGAMESKVPALLIGASADANLVQEAAKIGVSGFLLKPFTPEGLWEKVKPLLGA
jgi:two-component system chemotaxis response regulator CheY